MDINQLKTFKLVALEGSITQAAHKRYLSQAAISAHIKALESTLGLSLFERSAHGMSLTKQGIHLLPFVEQTLKAHDKIFDEAERIQGKISGKLAIGIGSSASSEILRAFISLIAERYPNIQVEVKQGKSPEILADLMSNQLDAIFYNDSTPPKVSLNTLKIAEFGVFLVAPFGLIDKKTPFNWQLLNDHPWVTPNPQTCCGTLAHALFNEHKITPTRLIQIDHENMMSSLISSGLGLGLLHTEAAQTAEKKGEITILHEVKKAVPVYFAYQSKRHFDPVIGAANNLIQELISE
ncbi:LysR family transcriptional regulator [Marinomonas transparens]|uniref:LysR family transcriptional regulator n=1 Tax=Marinomonas transparens TaxID=2795388 RepID=A0A934JNU3_9GAMM|nr:LysR family transcriptional regulator [Marinomonas transparens]MBJ7537389.1 LysR family transcriptional regulator [Marinomonas transparens]